MRNRPASIFTVILFSLYITAYGQKSINSPYARFNLGNFGVGGPFRSLSMGGTGIAMRDNSSIYLSNPASYTSIDTTSFLFDFGLDFTAYGLDDGNEKFLSGDMNFNHLFMGFPIARRMGLALGVVPVSNGYYYLADNITSGDSLYDPNIGEVAYVHKGEGGLSGIFAGTGLEISKNLSVGINMTIISGKLQRLNQFEFADYTSSFNQRSTENLRIFGINLDFGLQYHANLGKSHFLTLGASYTGSKNYRSKKEVINERFAIYSYPPYSPDTLTYYYNESKDSTIMPANYRFGVSFGKRDKWVAEFDYVYIPWADASIHGDNSTLASTSSYRFGLEFIPDKYSNESFMKRIEYRVGAHYGDSYLILNGYQLKQYGATAGFAIRLRNTYSRATVYFDYTRREGNLPLGLPNENIYSIGASLNFYDFWFRKKQFE
jgi:hypothetical protein